MQSVNNLVETMFFASYYIDLVWVSILEMWKSINKWFTGLSFSKQQSLMYILPILTASAAKCRMDLVRHVAATVIVSLKDKADSAYKDMNDWLGARFLKEMERWIFYLLILS